MQNYFIISLTFLSNTREAGIQIITLKTWDMMEQDTCAHNSSKKNLLPWSIWTFHKMICDRIYIYILQAVTTEHIGMHDMNNYPPMSRHWFQELKENAFSTLRVKSRNPAYERQSAASITTSIAVNEIYGLKKNTTAMEPLCQTLSCANAPSCFKIITPG